MFHKLRLPYTIDIEVDANRIDLYRRRVIRFIQDRISQLSREHSQQGHRNERPLPRIVTVGQ